MADEIEKIEFEATATGYFNNLIINKGDKFYAHKTFKGAWFKAVPQEEPAPKTKAEKTNALT